MFGRRYRNSVYYYELILEFKMIKRAENGPSFGLYRGNIKYFPEPQLPASYSLSYFLYMGPNKQLFSVSFF